MAVRLLKGYIRERRSNFLTAIAVMLNLVQHLLLPGGEILKRPMKRVQGMVQDDGSRYFKYLFRILM
jgi:hypothetical protein